MAVEKDFYKLVCKDRFDTIDGKLDSICTLLKGDGEKPGFAERLRTIERRHKVIIRACCVAVGAVFVQFIIWVRGWFGG